MNEGKQAEIDQHVARIVEALDLDPDNDYAPRSMWRADCALIVLGLIPVIIGLIGMYIISRL